MTKPFLVSILILILNYMKNYMGLVLKENELIVLINKLVKLE